MIRRFFELNRKAAKCIESVLPQLKEDLPEANIYGYYEEAVASYIKEARPSVVVDVGGGNTCPFAWAGKEVKGAKIIAIDVSANAMKDNTDVDEKRVADITKELPLADGEADFLVSRSVLEHITDIDKFFENSSKVLKEGGYFIHLFPLGFAIFAIINKMLPNIIAKKILYFIMPEHEGIGGFPVHYKKCYYSAMLRLLDTYGFEVVEKRVSYYQSIYFNFFLPVYLVSAFFDTLFYLLKWKKMGAYMFFVARKK